MSYDVVPQALKQRDQWVTWRNENGTKVPYNPRTGHKASSTNANTWTSFEVAAKAAQQRQHSGVGFVFSKDDPYAGIDLDDCLIDGQLATWAAEIVETMDSYTEVSPSGTGLKIWVEGSVPSAVKTAQLEIYDRARYFTVTGHRYDSAPLEIRNVNGALTALYERYRREDAAPTMTTRPAGDEHARQWAQKKLADAIRMVTMAVDGEKHDTLIDAGRLAGGAIPHITEWEIETALFAAIEGRAIDKKGAREAIRDGIAYGKQKPLPVPPPPPQPVFDEAGEACCPTHKRPLSAAKNGNGWTCRTRDASTPSGWCDFWWKGEGYVAPQRALVVEGTVITAPSEALPVARYVLYRMDGLRALPPVSWLITGEVPAGLFTVVCGPSGAGKSFLTVEYAILVARAHPDRVVVYVAAEGGSGYAARVAAWIGQHGGDEPQNLVFVLQDVAMLDPRAVHDFIATIRSHDPILTIVDTLARSMVGGDENSAKDMGLFVNGCDVIRRETGSAVIVVHHSGKSGTGYRGSSALYAASDSWIDVANDDGLITVSCGKAKDWQPFSPRYLRLITVGDSCVLLPSDQVSQRNTELSEGQRKVLETLAMDIFTGPGAKRTELVGATGINEVTMYKILSRLKRETLIEQSKRGDPYKITPFGLTRIKNYHRALREQRGKLSNYPETITDYQDTSATNYQTIITSPLGEDVIVDSSSGSEKTTAQPNELRGLDWEYLRVCFRTKDETAIRRHCAIHRAKTEEILAQLRSEA